MSPYPCCFPLSKSELASIVEGMVAGQPARQMIWVCFPHDAEASTSSKIFHRFSHRWDFIPAIFPFPCPCWLAYRWRSGSRVALHSIHLRPVNRIPSKPCFRRLKSVVLSTIRISVAQHRWCSGSKVICYKSVHNPAVLLFPFGSGGASLVSWDHKSAPSYWYVFDFSRMQKSKSHQSFSGKPWRVRLHNLCARPSLNRPAPLV